MSSKNTGTSCPPQAGTVVIDAADRFRQRRVMNIRPMPREGSVVSAVSRIQEKQTIEAGLLQMEQIGFIHQGFSVQKPDDVRHFNVILPLWRFVLRTSRWPTDGLATYRQHAGSHRDECVALYQQGKEVLYDGYEVSLKRLALECGIDVLAMPEVQSYMDSGTSAWGQMAYSHVLRVFGKTALYWQMRRYLEPSCRIYTKDRLVHVYAHRAISF